MRGVGTTSWWVRASRGSGPGRLRETGGNAGQVGAGRPARRRPRAHLVRLTVLAMVAAVLPLAGAVLAQPAEAATTCPSGGCTVNVSGFDFTSNTALNDFTYIVNVDNSKLPSDPLSLSHGEQQPDRRRGRPAPRTTVHLPRRPLPDLGARRTTTRCGASTSPCPTPRPPTARSTHGSTSPSRATRTRCRWARSASSSSTTTPGPTAPRTPRRPALKGFKVGLEEQTAQRRHRRLQQQAAAAAASCLTDATGFVQINDLGPGHVLHRRARRRTAPATRDPDSRWYADHHHRRRPAAAGRRRGGRDGTGAPGEQLWEPPNNRTAYWFGFVCTPQPFDRQRAPARSPAGAELGGVGAVHHRHLRRPGREPVRRAVATPPPTDRLRRPRRRARQLRHPERARRRLQPADLGRAAQLHHAVQAGARRRRADRRRQRHRRRRRGRHRRVPLVRLARRHVYKDTNNNGKYDAGVDPPIPNTDVDQRWRDGSIKESTVTDAERPLRVPDRRGRRARPVDHQRAGLRPLLRLPRAVGARRAHRRRDPVVRRRATRDPGEPVRPDRPGRRPADQPAPDSRATAPRSTGASATTRPAQPGQIVGITYFATTRNEFDARMPGARGLRAGHPRRDRLPREPRTRTASRTPPTTSSSTSTSPTTGSSPTRPRTRRRTATRSRRTATRSGTSRATTSPASSTRTSARTASRCRSTASRPRTAPSTAATPSPTTARTATTSPPTTAPASSGDDPVPLVAGTYITHAIMPKDATDTRACNPVRPRARRPRTSPRRRAPSRAAAPAASTAPCKRGGRQRRPRQHTSRTAIPPPPCTGDDHVIDQSTLTPRSNYYGNGRRARAAVRQAARRPEHRARTRTPTST